MLDKAPKRTPRQRAIFRRRMEVVRLRIRQAWGHRFRQCMRNRARYYAARRRMAGYPGMTLAQGFIRAFFDDIRRAGQHEARLVTYPIERRGAS